MEISRGRGSSWEGRDRIGRGGDAVRAGGDALRDEQGLGGKGGGGKAIPTEGISLSGGTK